MKKLIVDKKILSYIDWLDRLHRDDIEEFGGVVNRNKVTLNELWRDYFEFQNSVSARKMRADQFK